MKPAPSAIQRKYVARESPPATENSVSPFGSADLRLEIHKTIHDSKLSVRELGWRLGVQANWLYRVTNSNEPSCRLPAELLLPLILQTGDQRLLDYLNRACDRISVPARRVSRVKSGHRPTLDEVSCNFHRAMALFFELSDKPGQADREELLKALYQLACDVQALRLAVGRFEQPDLDL